MIEPAAPHDASLVKPAAPQAGSLRELLQVALPLIVSSGSVSLMYIANRVFLTWDSKESLAAVLPSGILHWTIISLLFGTVQYVNSFVAQYEGAGQRDRVAASVWQGIYLAAVGGILVTSLRFWAKPIFDAVGHEPAVAAREVEYFQMLSFSSLPMLLTAALTCFFSGRGQTLVVMAVNIIGVVVNIVGDYFLIFGTEEFPGLGIRGAGLATVLAQIVECLLLGGLFFRRSNRELYGTWKNRGFDRELFARFLKYGMPQGLHFFLDVASFAVFMLLIGRLGRDELAATNLAFNLNTLAFIPMIGLGTAVSTLVGQRIGEGRPEVAVRTTWKAFGLSAAYMLLFAAIYVLLPDVILRPYFAFSEAEDYSQLRDEVIVLLRFVAVYCFFDAIGIVFGFAIRGAGDTRFALVFSCITAWSLMVLPTVISVRWYGGGLLASWCSCTVYIIVLGLGFMARFQAGHWKSMRVIEPVSE